MSDDLRKRRGYSTRWMSSGAIEMSPDRLTTTPAKRTRLFVAIRKSMLCQMHSSVPSDSDVAQHRFPLAGVSVYLKTISRWQSVQCVAQRLADFTMQKFAKNQGRTNSGRSAAGLTLATDRCGGVTIRCASTASTRWRTSRWRWRPPARRRVPTARSRPSQVAAARQHDGDVGRRSASWSISSTDRTRHVDRAHQRALGVGRRGRP